MKKKSILFKFIEVENYDQILSELKNYVIDVAKGNDRVDFSLVPKKEVYQYCPTFKNWIEYKKLDLRGCAIIVKHPPYFPGIHTDNIGPDIGKYAMNFPIQNCDEAKTEFFGGDIKYKWLVNVNGLDYQEYDMSCLEVTDSYVLTGPLIFDVTVPHRVSNHTGKTRIVISFRFACDLTDYF